MARVRRGFFRRGAFVFGTFPAGDEEGDFPAGWRGEEKGEKWPGVAIIRSAWGRCGEEKDKEKQGAGENGKRARPFSFLGLIQRGGRFNFGACSAGIFSGEGPLYSALSRQEKKREPLPERLARSFSFLGG